MADIYFQNKPVFITVHAVKICVGEDVGDAIIIKTVERGN